MWAGGRIEFKRALRIGEPLKRDSEILAIDTKEGRSGKLVFDTVRHTVLAAGELADLEEHDLVYREPAKPGDPPPAAKPAPRNAAWQRELVADPVMLFRYSALTFIGHRIHYDLDYCRQEEGYPGLVVHGPLVATLLLDRLDEATLRARMAQVPYARRAYTPSNAARRTNARYVPPMAMQA
jgi:3-methylfumaryl-CoA hydratase